MYSKKKPARRTLPGRERFNATMYGFMVIGVPLAFVALSQADGWMKILKAGLAA